MRKKQSFNFFHKSFNKSKKYFKKKKRNILSNIDYKAIIHKCINFQIFKKQNVKNFVNNYNRIYKPI